MGGCCFAKITVVLMLLLGWGQSCYARCPLADKFAKEGKTEQEMMALNMCAISYNDDVSQMKLADSYMQGTNELDRDEKQALFMYQLAAENGNAEAQVKLAELLQTFDVSPARRKELKEYQAKLTKVNDETNAFGGEILHPYALLLLAAERPESKWYYPSLNRAAPARTQLLLKNYKITTEKRQIAMKEASRWKTRKLLEMAHEVLPEMEYDDFEKKLKNNATRTQAMAELKQRLTEYIAKN